MRRSKSDSERKKEILHFRTTEEVKNKIYEEVGERMKAMKRQYTTSELIESIIIQFFKEKESSETVQNA